MAWYREYGGFPPSQAREVKGGIKSQSRRGGFGQSWCPNRWIELIESFGLGARLTRGRAYARKGQVVSSKWKRLHFRQSAGFAGQAVYCHHAGQTSGG